MTAITMPEGFRVDAEGNLIHENNISKSQKIEDALATRLCKRAKRVQNAMSTFKEVVFAAHQKAIDEVLAANGAKKGGQKGNTRWISFDGTFKVEIQVRDRLEFGPELHAAQVLLGEYLSEVSTDANSDLRTLINAAFSVGEDQSCNVSDVLRLMRYQIKHPNWIAAMEAIKAAIRVTGSSTYARFYEKNQRGEWDAISLDLAKL
ncbi:MAG: DUF3164 family protein [Rhodospirillaceae bacterium]|nr:DUF3164 family protein [Rhodospirillales bacterium]